uniref:DNA-binding response regulator KdpE n=1 Tax=uncultured bacterium contig00038 TaxID=1181526 RepID=A0A806KR61_9BACT|nr:DNA-binding response regulator KdpE [uncultured bacterium contig00038]
MYLPLVLIVEDDDAMRHFLAKGLQKNDYRVVMASTGKEASLLARTHNPDLVLLDLGLPDADGSEFLRSFREWSKVPVLVVSARHQESQKVHVLDIGADDYLTKPFGLMELLARIRVALRHTLQKIADEPIIRSGTMQIDLKSRIVTQNGEEVKLTPTEFKLLSALASRGGKVATHHQLLNEVWGQGQTEQTHYLHIYMGKLRQKLEPDPTRPIHFIADVGVGYRLKVD